MCQNCLTLLLYISCFDDAIHVLLEMVDKKLDSPQSIAAATLKHFEDLIKHFDNHNSIAKNIQSIAAELKNRAETFIEKRQKEIEKKFKSLKVQEDLINFEGLTQEMVVKLAENGVKSLDDLADLAGDEFKVSI